VLCLARGAGRFFTLLLPVAFAAVSVPFLGSYAAQAAEPPPFTPGPVAPTAPTNSTSSPVSGAPAAFVRGRELMGRDPASAERDLAQATREAPTYGPAWYALAMTERRLGRHADAVVAYRRYLALVPMDREPLYGLGLSLLAVGQTDEAREVLARFVRDAREPRLVPFVEKARTTLAALPPVTSSADMSPAEAGPDALTLARTARAAGKIDEALRHYREATERHPDDATALFEAGDVCLLSGRYADAAGFLRKSTALMPRNAPAVYDLAVAERQLGQSAASARAFRAYLALAPDDADAYYGLAAVLAASGDRAGAAEALRAYLKLEHRPTEARWVARAERRLAILEGRGKSVSDAARGAAAP